jgi:hypothetical protein
MSRNRNTYHLTRFQVLAICDAINTTNKTRIGLLAKLEGRPDCISTRAILNRRIEADAVLVRDLLAGLLDASSQPRDHHCLFAAA